MTRWHHWCIGHELQDMVRLSKIWCAAVHRVAKSQTWLGDWTMDVLLTSLFLFHMNFRITISISIKYFSWILIKIVLFFARMIVLTTLCFSPYDGLFLHFLKIFESFHQSFIIFAYRLKHILFNFSKNFIFVGAHINCLFFNISKPSFHWQHIKHN